MGNLSSRLPIQSRSSSRISFYPIPVKHIGSQNRWNSTTSESKISTYITATRCSRFSIWWPCRSSNRNQALSSWLIKSASKTQASTSILKSACKIAKDRRHRTLASSNLWIIFLANLSKPRSREHGTYLSSSYNPRRLASQPQSSEHSRQYSASQWPRRKTRLSSVELSLKTKVCLVSRPCRLANHSSWHLNSVQGSLAKPFLATNLQEASLDSPCSKRLHLDKKHPLSSKKLLLLPTLRN